MRFVIQRVSYADVKVEGKTVGEIGKGFLVLVGNAATDTCEIADRMVKKMLGLRIFEDAEGNVCLMTTEKDKHLLLFMSKERSGTSFKTIKTCILSVLVG